LPDFRSCYWQAHAVRSPQYPAARGEHNRLPRTTASRDKGFNSVIYIGISLRKVFSILEDELLNMGPVQKRVFLDALDEEIKIIRAKLS
jgi:hypothetical protein